MKPDHRITELYQKYLQGTVSPSELSELYELIHREKETPSLDSMMTEELARPVNEVPEHVHQITQRVRARLLRQRPKRWVSAPSLIRVAAMLALIAAAAIWIFTSDPFQDDRSSTTAGTTIMPGGNKARLTLTDGRTIRLNESQAGLVMGEEIHYIDGSLVIAPLDQRHARPTDTASFTLVTPRGGQYQVTLPDGTHVWLNAASSLQYAANFSFASQRIVILEGEAYFEVNPDKDRPFIVKSPKQTVEVLGTHFNMHAYSASTAKTTLLEGSVKVSNSSGKKYRILQPGEQAETKGNRLVVNQVNVVDAIAWHKGEFSFNGKSFAEIMNELERWYDIKIEYTNGVPSIKLFGGIYRNDRLQTVLELLTANHIPHHLEGRTLTIGE